MTTNNSDNNDDNNDNNKNDNKSISNLKNPKAGVGANFGKSHVYVAFDILYLNQQQIMDLSLNDRSELLKRVIKPQTHVFEVIKQLIGSKVGDVTQALDEAVDEGSEGPKKKNWNRNNFKFENKN